MVLDTSAVYYIIAKLMKDTVQESAQIKLWLSESVAGCDQLQIDKHSPVLIKQCVAAFFLESTFCLSVFCNV